MKYVIEIEIHKPHTTSEIVGAIKNFADNIKEWSTQSGIEDEERLPTMENNDFHWELWNDSRDGYKQTDENSNKDVRIECTFSRIE